jgi:aspartate oxidase
MKLIKVFLPGSHFCTGKHCCPMKYNLRRSKEVLRGHQMIERLKENNGSHAKDPSTGQCMRKSMTLCAGTHFRAALMRTESRDFIIEKFFQYR